MLDADFWLDQAAQFADRARTTHDPQLYDELLDLAAVCEAVAAKIEEHAPSG
jgi:hypothetical protein